MTWRVAKSLLVGRAEMDALFPDRDRASEGLLGDAAHASRNSDHNPWVKDPRGVGVVRAWDADAGPGLYPGGNDIVRRVLLTAVLKAAKAGHPAFGAGSYIISEGSIYSRTYGWAKREYTGVNAHRAHVHVSVGRLAVAYDSTVPWGLAASYDEIMGTKPVTGKPVPTGPLLSSLRYGVSNASVRGLQRALVLAGYDPGEIDGVYGAQTLAAVAAFQKAQGWTGQGADGLVGPTTYKRLFGRSPA